MQMRVMEWDYVIECLYALGEGEAALSPIALGRDPQRTLESPLNEATRRTFSRSVC